MSAALDPKHLDQLHASAITPEVIAARGYASTTSMAALRRLGFSQAQQRHGLVIPIYNVWGTLAFHLLRPNEPRIPYGKTRPAKYEFPHGLHMCLDVPNLPWLRAALKNPHLPLWLTEGSKKADSLASCGVCAVSVIGVWNFRGTNDDGGLALLGDFEPIAFNDRLLYIAYDSDVMVKPEVHGALARLGATLKNRHADVRYVYLPSRDGAKIGIDDFLARDKTVQDAVDLASATLKASPQGGALRWQQHLALTDKGQIKATIANYVELLTHHPDWAGHFTFDSFRHQLCLDGVPFDPHSATNVAHRLGIDLGVHIGQSKSLREAMGAVAAEHPVDPLRDFLQALPPWDKVPRLTRWLVAYFGATDSLYTRWAGRAFLAGMLSRALSPGGLMRLCLILEGPEGNKKSLAVEVLGAPFASTMSASLEGKESQMRLKGVWVMELPELDALSRSEETRIKAFLSTTTDTYIPKYESDPASYARRTVFIGTTNEREYLKGQHGNTRYLPVRTSAIDVEGLERDRDHLLAEGLRALAAHPRWWEVPRRVGPALEEERARRKKVPIYREPILEWLSRPDVGHQRTLTMKEIMEGALHVTDLDKWPRLQQPVGEAMRDLGWYPDYEWLGAEHKNRRIWVREEGHI